MRLSEDQPAGSALKKMFPFRSTSNFDFPDHEILFSSRVWTDISVLLIKAWFQAKTLLVIAPLTFMKTFTTRFAFPLALAATVGVAWSAEQNLFNGKDLSGWQGNPQIWSVQDGAITGTTSPKSPIKHNTFLVWTNGTLEDFELRLSYRIVRGNSGIQYRSKVISQGPFGPIVGGYQADFEAGKTYSGILYEERGRGILAQRGQKTIIEEAEGKHQVKVTGSVGDSDDIQAKIKDEDWNDYLIIAKGNHLQHFINGMQAVDVTDRQESKAAKSGILALQIHQGPPMTVQFKNIQLKPLK
jgi:hypothetical protein